MNKNEFVLFCKCGCKNGVVLKASSEGEGWDKEFSIQLVSDNYYVMQNKGKMSLKEKLKRIWYIISNKEYCYFDILVEAKDMIEFKKFCCKIGEL